MRILLTRPIEQSQSLAASLREQNVEVEIFPLMTVHKYDEAPTPKEDWQAVIVTSANALKYADLSHIDNDTPILAVGDKTADRAKTLGFAHVISADGNLEKLSGTIKQELTPVGGPLLYLRGKHITGPLAAELTEDGYKVIEYTVYETKPISKIDKALINLLTNDDIDFIPFYSRRSALIFKELIEEAGLEGCLENITALSISANVASEIDGLPWKTKMISDRPTQSDLFNLIGIGL